MTGSLVCLILWDFEISLTCGYYTTRTGSTLRSGSKQKKQKQKPKSIEVVTPHLTSALLVLSLLHQSIM